MNPVLANILDTRSVVLPDGTSLALHHGSVPREEGEFLQDLIAETRPSLSLEVGLAHGISALFMCEALQRVGAARHIIIDPYQVLEPPWGGSFQGVGLDNLRKAGYGSFIEFIGLPSDRALPQLAAQGVKIDFAFIDGFHTFDHTLIDFFYIDRLLNVGGVVVIDDTNWPSVRKVCRFIATNRAYRVFRCLGPHVSPSVKRRALFRLGHFASRSWIMRHLLKPEVVELDTVLGLVPGSRCIAFQKQADDTRRWDAHHDF